MRYTIECKDLNDIILGMKCIKHLSDLGEDSAIVGFNDEDRLWYVKKTKTGYSARTKE